MYIKRRTFAASEDVNPMDFVGNLSDIMLVLAVGILLALVSAFHVNLNGSDQGAVMPAAVSGDTQIEIPLDGANADGISQEFLEKSGYTEYGTVYTDQDGHLYILGVSPDE